MENSHCFLKYGIASSRVAEQCEADIKSGPGVRAPGPNNRPDSIEEERWTVVVETPRAQRRSSYPPASWNRDVIVQLSYMERSDKVFHSNDGQVCRQCGSGMYLARAEYAGSFSRRVFECQACGGTMICGHQSTNTRWSGTELNAGNISYFNFRVDA